MSEQQPNPTAWKASLPAAQGTLLDYFAANAPAEVPEWFQFPRPALMEVPITLAPYRALRASPKWEQMSQEARALAYHVLEAMTCSDNYEAEGDAVEVATFAHDMIVAARKAREEAITHNEHAEREWQANRFFAWRWHYARVMCAWETKN